jgi:succinate dehydrogenase/fumarate reductase flavoprotein subunit
VWFGFLGPDRGDSPFALRAELESLMWDKVGIVRHEHGLEEALAGIAAIAERAHHVKAPGGPAFNLEWGEAINLVNLTTVAEMVTRSAIVRRESRGAHYRSDMPASDPQWLTRIRLSADGHGGMTVSLLPIAFTRVVPPELSTPQA